MEENEKINVEETTEKTSIVDEIKEKAGKAAETVKEAYEKASEKAQEEVEKIKSEIDDYTEEQDAEDVKNNKVMAVLAYFGILVLIPILCAKDSKFAKFHSNQGLVLFICSIVCSILVKIPVIKWVAGLLSLVLFVFAIMGIVYAIQGKAKELPVIGNWKLLK